MPGHGNQALPGPSSDASEKGGLADGEGNSHLGLHDAMGKLRDHVLAAWPGHGHELQRGSGRIQREAQACSANLHAAPVLGPSSEARPTGLREGCTLRKCAAPEPSPKSTGTTPRHTASMVDSWMLTPMLWMSLLELPGTLSKREG